MYMIGTILVLFITAIIILIKDYKTESSVWLSCFLFLCGLGSFSSFMTTRFFIKALDYKYIDSIYYISAWLSVSSHYLAPVCILIYAILSSNLINENKNKKILYMLLFIPEILCYIVLPIKNNDLKTTREFLHYIKILCVVELPYLFGSIVLLIHSYLKEKSYLIKKHKLFNIILIVPSLIYIIMFNFIMRSAGINHSWKVFSVLVPIHFLIFVYFSNKFAVFGVTMKFDKYNFAFENIIDYITDSIIIIDENLKIKEVNNIFYEKFQVNKNKKYNEYIDLIRESSLKNHQDLLTNLINNAHVTRTSQFTQIKVMLKEVSHFEIQVNCVIVNGDYFGTIVFLKDITTQKRNVELMIEKERLRSLSQLIGGVAHNLKTPIMSLAGGLAIIQKDTNKICTYLKDDSNDDIEKLITEINSWNERGQSYLCYMTDIINAVKNQLKDFDPSKAESFIVKDVIKDIVLLMSFELKKNKCKLIQEININESTEIHGDINSLIQVLDNLISNAIDAVNDNRNIILSIYEEHKNIIFSVSNEGDIIPDHIQKRIFKEMVTTKGKDGTGLGLYISKSIIKSRFKGDMYFKCNNEKNTFFISIPCEGAKEL